MPDKIPKLPSDIEPQNSMLVVVPDPLPETVGLIHVPATQRSQRPESGVVVGLAPGLRNSGYYEIGDRVLFGMYAGVAVGIDKQVFQFLDASEILALIPKGAQIDADPPGVER